MPFTFILVDLTFIQKVLLYKAYPLHQGKSHLTIWVVLCIAGGILSGKIAPDVATTLNEFSIYQVSIPIAVCLFFMMYPIMVKIDFAQARRAD